MCGILAVLGIKKDTDIQQLRKDAIESSKRQTHRGPDWSGVFVSEKHDSMIVHERLSIVDIKGGEQPLVSKDKKHVLGVNGEIYNHEKLEQEIKNCHPITGSDCEVFLHLYKESKGKKKESDPAVWLNRVHGMWAFVLVDEETGDFLIGRDHIGIIPLYIGMDKQHQLWIASELKALHDRCIWFQEFSPGHYLQGNNRKPIKFTSSSMGLKPWYQPRWYSNPSEVPKKRLNLNELRKKMMDAVKSHLMCHVPFAVLLSGGLDSSLIAAMASKVIEESPDERWYPKLHTCSIGLKNSPDLLAARKVAKHLKSIHHEFIYTIQEGLDARVDAIRMLETYYPTTIRSGTPMYLLARRIKAMGIKMVLSGEGADEAFGGYLYFHKCPTESAFQKECVDKLKELHEHDCLRANKAMMAWGVELRVPFLDKGLLDYVMTMAPIDKMCGTLGGKLKKNEKPRIEKWCLREALGDLIPKEVAWRQKEQFSDGVGYGWIDAIRDFSELHVSDEELEAARFRFPHNTPATKEAYWDRMVYEQYFPPSLNNGCSVKVVPGNFASVACSTPAAILWDPSFKKFADCSGRSVAAVHASAVDEGYKAKVKQNPMLETRAGQETGKVASK